MESKKNTRRGDHKEKNKNKMRRMENARKVTYVFT